MKGTLQHLEKGLLAYSERFQCSREQAVVDLFCFLAVKEKLRASARGDIIITCQLCADDAWWQENYGIFWQAAQWWECGPFGLNCSN